MLLSSSGPLRVYPDIGCMDHTATAARGTPAAEPGLMPWIKIAFLVAAVLLLLAQPFLFDEYRPPKPVSYSELLAEVRSGHVAKMAIDEQELLATLKGKETPEQRIVANRIPGLAPEPLVALLAEHRVELNGDSQQVGWLESLFWSWVVPIAAMMALFAIVNRRLAKRSGPLSFGRSHMKIYDRAAHDSVTFEDVAGVDEAEAELVEVVDFLKTPQKYRALGARTPKGVLLLGPPGTGKTLLARAVAGEAAVPFFSLSGSDFVEMFVGVGAARVRDMFEQAKQRAPCIVFIDELDAIGKSRGGLAALGSNEEREQTLNQLLVEMDGFDASAGVVIMAATNRPEILDPALVRAGRFDRQVLVDRPDLRGREDILRVHARKLMLGADVDLHVIAQRTPGMVGADLANLLNEGAINAARRGGHEIAASDVEEAIDRIQLGSKKKNRAMEQDEKLRVAYHESGHALVALSLTHTDPVHKITIIPRSIGALGATLQLPTEDRYLMTRESLLDRLCVLLGGRAAEELCFGSSSTGAQDDLERATETARQMVCRFGMSAKLGPLTYGRAQGLRFLEGAAGLNEVRNFSEATAQSIDQEVRAIIDSEFARARAVLLNKRAQLERLAERLLVVETLERDELLRVVSEDEPATASVAVLRRGAL